MQELPGERETFLLPTFSTAVTILMKGGGTSP